MDKINKIRIFFLVLFAFITIVLGVDSCKKPNPTLKPDLLTSTSWSLSMYNSTAFSEDEGAVFVFNADGTADATIMVINFTRIYSNWIHNTDNGILWLDYDEYKIQTLTDSTLVIRLVTSPYTTLKFNAFKTVYRVATGVSDLSDSSALIHANVRTNNSPVNVFFEYGLTNSYGNTIEATPSAIGPLTKTALTCKVTGLNAGTLYHFRIKTVTNSETAYGSDMTLTTFNALKVSDVDKHSYNTITIGTQTWMAQNLKTTRYSNGDTIPFVSEYYTYGHNGTGWIDLTTGARSKNTTVADFDSIYGWYYNWFAVNDNRNICPVGWHVPTFNEWTVLIEYLGYSSIKLKESGTSHWYTPNLYATNETGFSALPASYRANMNGYFNPGTDGYWWTSTQTDSTQAKYSSVSLYDINISSGNIIKTGGLSIRCIKN